MNLWGSTMAPIALAFAVLSIEDSASALGQVLAARSVPMVLFLLLGGVLADRLGRWRVIQVSNLVSALSQALAAWLVITGQAELWHLIVIEAVNGTSSAASFPAMQGMIPQLVPRAQLQSANVLLSMVRGVLVVVGPDHGGVAGGHGRSRVGTGDRRADLAAVHAPAPAGARARAGGRRRHRDHR